jgi:hypothetical protein
MSKFATSLTDALLGDDRELTDTLATVINASTYRSATLLDHKDGTCTWKAIGKTYESRIAAERAVDNAYKNIANSIKK